MKTVEAGLGGGRGFGWEATIPARSLSSIRMSCQRTRGGGWGRGGGRGRGGGEEGRRGGGQLLKLLLALSKQKNSSTGD